MILILDNRDSFVFNIARYIQELGYPQITQRSHDITLADIEALAPAGIIISPGPGRPRDAGISCDVVQHFTGRCPILGVCLGHQCIAEVYSGEIARARVPRYGQAITITHDGSGLFHGLDEALTVGLYHSLIVRESGDMLRHLRVTATSPEGEIMALAHKHHALWGVQFHPESVLSDHGHDLFHAFLRHTLVGHAVC